MDKNSRQSKFSSLAGSNSKKSQNLSNFVKNKNILNLRIEYIGKLNKKIEKLKKSKKYYKGLCRHLLNQQNKQNFNTYNDGNVNITMESVDKKYSSFEVINSNIQSPLNKQKNEFEKEIPEISISISSTSNVSSKSTLFNKDQFTISTEINLSFLAKYKNLDKFTSGEYSKNRNLRIATQKYIQYYIAKIHDLKEEKINEPFLTKKSNTIIGDFSTSLFFTQEEKFRNDSFTKRTSKRIFTNEKYSINLEEPKNSLCFIGRNKLFNYNKRNTLKRYLIIKTNSSFDSVKKRSSNVFRNINISACSSFRKEKNEINKIKTRDEYEQEVEFKEKGEKKLSSRVDSMKIKVECKELKFEEKRK